VTNDAGASVALEVVAYEELCEYRVTNWYLLGGEGDVAVSVEIDGEVVATQAVAVPISRNACDEISTDPVVVSLSTTR
jgi:hypothetical protein